MLRGIQIRDLRRRKICGEKKEFRTKRGNENTGEKRAPGWEGTLSKSTGTVSSGGRVRFAIYYAISEVRLDVSGLTFAPFVTVMKIGFFPFLFDVAKHWQHRSASNEENHVLSGLPSDPISVGLWSRVSAIKNETVTHHFISMSKFWSEVRKTRAGR